MARIRILKIIFLALLASGTLGALAGVAQATTEPPPQWYSNRDLLNSSPVTALTYGEIKFHSASVGYIHCTSAFQMAVWNEGGRGLGQLEGIGTNACKAPELEKGLEEVFGIPVTIFATGELPAQKELRQAIVCKEESKLSLEECKSPSERVEKEVAWRVKRRPASFPWKMELLRGERREEPDILVKIGIPPAGQTCYPAEEGHPALWTQVPAGCINLDVIAPQIPDEVVFHGTLVPVLENGAGNGLSPSRLYFEEEAGKLVSSEDKVEEPETSSEGEIKISDVLGPQLIWAQ